MPYIKSEDQEKFKNGLAGVGNSFLDAIDKFPASNCGELNFLLTKVIISYMESKGLNYQVINDIQGALKCCSDEYGRRIVGPYEDTKIAQFTQNGDIYPSKFYIL